MWHYNIVRQRPLVTQLHEKLLLSLMLQNELPALFLFPTQLLRPIEFGTVKKCVVVGQVGNGILVVVTMMQGRIMPFVI